MNLLCDVADIANVTRIAWVLDQNPVTISSIKVLTGITDIYVVDYSFGSRLHHMQGLWLAV